MEDVIGEPLGAMVDGPNIDPGTANWPKPRREKVWRGVPDYFKSGPGDNFGVGAIVQPQGPAGPRFRKEQIPDPMGTGGTIMAWHHIDGGTGPGPAPPPGVPRPASNIRR